MLLPNLGGPGLVINDYRVNRWLCKVSAMSEVQDCFAVEAGQLASGHHPRLARVAFLRVSNDESESTVAAEVSGHD